MRSPLKKLYRAQTKALLAAITKRLEASGNPMVEIMIPLVSIEAELEKSLPGSKKKPRSHQLTYHWEQ